MSSATRSHAFNDFDFGCISSPYPDFSIITFSNYFLIGEFYFLMRHVEVGQSSPRWTAETDETEITGFPPNAPLLLTYICFFVFTLQ